MARSGGVNTSSYEGRYLTLSWTASQSVASNKSTISWTLTANGGSSSWYATGPVTVVIDGTTVYSLSANNRYNMYKGTVASGSLDIAHNSDGTKSFTVSVSAAIYSTSTNCTGSATFTLDPITGTSVVQRVVSKTETSITMEFEADTTVDYAWYSINGGSTWIGIWAGSTSSGTYTISGLDHASTYHVRTKVKRKDSQTESTSSTLDVKTYSYPYATDCPNFVIGNEAVVTIYNPIAREASVTITAGNTTILTTTTTGTSVTIPTSSASALYSTIPNAMSGTYSVAVNYDNHPSTRTGTYSVGTDSAPTITGATYQDRDSTVTAITGNNQKIVQGKSTVRFTASGLSAKNSATISSVKVNVGTEYNMTVSGSTATVSNIVINSSEQRTAVVTITDSRGLTASKTINLDTIEYQVPTVSATAKRNNGFYTATNVNVSSNYTSIGSNTTTIQLKARKVGTSSYTVTQTVTDGDNTVTLDNEFAWEIVLTITDSFGGSSTFNLSVGKGIPLFYFDIDKSSVSMDMFPEHSNAFEVNGDIYFTVEPSDDLMQALADIGWSDAALGETGLIDVSTNETGSIPQTGVPATNSGYYRTAYIPVYTDAYTATTNTPSTASSFRIHGYDSSFNWLQQIDYFTTDGTEMKRAFTIPEHEPPIEYLRLSYIKTGTSGLFPGRLEGV